MIETHHPYDPLPEGSGITYQIYQITGAWHDENFGLDVLTRTYSHLQRIANSKTTSQIFGYLPLFAGYQHQMDVQDTPIDWNNTLTDGIACIGDDYYIGEAISNIGRVHIPCIAKLAFNPYPGQTIEKVSTIYKSSLEKTFVLNFHWKYKTVDHYDQWGAFTDCWRTGLREYHTEVSPSVADAVYNYVFMKNVGLIDLWYGQFQSDGSIFGYEYYAVDYPIP